MVREPGDRGFLKLDATILSSLTFSCGGLWDEVVVGLSESQAPGKATASSKDSRLVPDLSSSCEEV